MDYPDYLNKVGPKVQIRVINLITFVFKNDQQFNSWLEESTSFHQDWQ